MRYLMVFCFLFALGCGNSGTKKASVDQQVLSGQNIQTVAVEVSIKGMSCTGCEQTIQTGIAGLSGIKQVRANYKIGKAFIEFIPGIADTLQMKSKISTSGYIVAGFKNIPLDTLRAKL